ncbi:TetR family transcriptional regulator [Sphingomonas hankookensis]|uniref:TetR family transcriptional regulator n=1 Tax=Sphingomonas hankookensis TaxID=563996 RepID=UPI001F58FDD9|nr:TetR family transcriptional regulator [Sphingomonas hankookensis]
MDFQRARSDEQRELRRQAILDTAIAMLAEMPVTEMGLNELGRRVGLAKSNVLRYFETREAVLLELMDDQMGAWLAELDRALTRDADAAAPLEVRAHRLTIILSSTLAARTILCDLIGAQGAVLERNVSTPVAKQHKRASMARLDTLSNLVRRHLPELGNGTEWFCLMGLLSAGALATYVPTPASLLVAYADEPDLGRLNLALEEALRMALTSVLLGVLPRSPATSN